MTESASYDKPVPAPTGISEPFWKATTEGLLVLQKCGSCGAIQHYPRPFCVTCLEQDLQWVKASGKGTLYSFTIVRRAASKAFEPDLPYVLAIVELQEGPHMTANVIDISIGALRVGMPLDLMFTPAGDGIAIPQWRAAEAG